jgi:tRNA-splicing ligase RtcB
VPSGFSVHNTPPTVNDPDLYEDVINVAKLTGQDLARVIRSYGTLGGGNHFLEYGITGQQGWLTVHTGSRNFGYRVAAYFQDIANKTYPYDQKSLSWLEGDDFVQYCHCMQVAQRFAAANRRIILASILSEMNVVAIDTVESVHNYIEFAPIDEKMIFRKGAICASKDERVIIPWNMRDGLIIGEGKGNADWNCSAPHGAGRTMARGRAKRELSMEEFTSQMRDVYSTCINKDTLDESPMAYKDSASVEAQIVDTVTITHKVKPIYNFKAGAEPPEYVCNYPMGRAPLYVIKRR